MRNYTNLKAVQILEWGKEPILVEVTEPQKVHGRQALIRMQACGVCHTDVHLIEGFYDLGEGRKLSMAERGISLPITLGHEPAGIVEQLGEEAQRDQQTVNRGDSVVVYPWLGCGSCRKCRGGRENLCETKARTLGIFQNGGYAEYLLVPDVRYLVPIGNVDPTEAAPLACSGITAYSAVKKSNLGPSDLAVVIGTGGLGTTAIQIVKNTRGAKLIAVDIDDEKLKLAKDLGADDCINSRGLAAKEVVGKIREMNSGFAADAVFDFVGSPATSALGFEALARGGRLILLGLFGGESKFPLPMFPLKGAEVVGNFTGTLEDLAEVVQLARRGLVKPVVSEVHGLEEVNDVIGRLIEGKVKGRAVIKP